jgi:hypothetical protein
VNGHELNAAALADGGVGLGEEVVELSIERGGGRDDAVGGDGVEEGEIDFGIFESGGIDAAGTAEGTPGALDPGSEGWGFRQTPAEVEGAAEDIDGTCEALLAVFGEEVAALVVEFRDGEVFECLVVGAGKEVEVREGEAAPWGAEDGEPRDAIHGMEQGAGEGAEVEEFLTLGEVFDFDGAKGNVAMAEEGDDLREMVASADEDSDTILIAGGAGLLDARQVSLENVEDIEGFLLLGGGNFGEGRPAVGRAEDAGVEVESGLERVSSGG